LGIWRTQSSISPLLRRKILGRPVVEFLRQLAHRRVAALFDVVKDILDGLAHLGNVRGVLLGGNAGLQKNGHDLLSRG